MASRRVDGHLLLSMIAERDIVVWIISALLALGVGWSRYAKWKTRNKLVRELAAMDPERREKVLSRLNPRLAMEAREQLMKRFRIT
jgi:hypothetical protein